MNNSKLLFLSLFICIAAIFSCKKEQFSANPSALSFSTDTVYFDTLFTTISSSTRNFRLYNSSDKILKIASINLENNNSAYRINVDGFQGPSITDIEILPNDSIWVFVELTPSANNTNTPLLITDAINVTIAGNTKRVELVAYGQDAVFILPNTQINGLPPLHLFPENSNTTWTNEKPIVIYGFTAFDSTATLSIEPGTKIYMHGNAGLWIYRDAQITANGTVSQPIIFQGDRLEPAYENIPGQWDRIWINEGQADNTLSNVIIKNSTFGIQAETLPFSYNLQAPTSGNKLVLNNVQILNSALFGLFLRNYQVEANNCIIAEAGQYCIGVTGSGKYNFNHCTINNNSTIDNRETPAVFLTNAYKDGAGTIQIREIEQANFVNTIIYGRLETELNYETVGTGVTNNLNFDYCLIKTEEKANAIEITNSLLNVDPTFKEIAKFDYSLNNASPAINAGTLTSLSTDINGDSRVGNPDIGAIEFGN